MVQQVLSALRMMAQAGLLEDGHVKSLYLIIEPVSSVGHVLHSVDQTMLLLLEYNYSQTNVSKDRRF